MTAGLASGAQTEPDHSAKVPGNQTQFLAGEGGTYGPGCATAQVLHLAPAAWSVSDPQDVRISSANDASNGVATCINATNGPVSVTATLTSGKFTQSMQATLTCK